MAGGGGGPRAPASEQATTTPRPAVRVWGWQGERTNDEFGAFMRPASDSRAFSCRIWRTCGIDKVVTWNLRPQRDGA
jgi:hypothetical protein